jgi:ATP-dependent RNA helicase DeaD
MEKFIEMNIEVKLLRAVEELGFKEPMPIQSKAIPLLLESDQDLVGLAQTGTGKTAAFGLPILQRVNKSKKHVQAVILCPTRELCIQITGDLAAYAKYIPSIKIVAVYGGTSIEDQIRKIKRGAQIIVATPGRMLDLINRKQLNISKINFVVLDEADEMLNMGFKDELDGILSDTPDTKNTYLFSATMPREVARIANEYMTDAVEITVGKRNAGAENVQHICYVTEARKRYLVLKRVVDFSPDIYGIVFCRTRIDTKELAAKLIKDGYNADALHGDLSQAQRDHVMDKFRSKALQILVATDVAARGLDINDVTHIINYNLPDDFQVYTHRSGRTGRAGKKGISIAIVHLREKEKIRRIEKIINKKFDYLPLPDGKTVCENQLFHLIDRMLKVEVDEEQINPFMDKIYHKLESLSREQIITQFVSLEFNRFLSYYKNAPDLNILSKKEKKKKRNEPGQKRTRLSDSEVTRFFINVGKTQNIRPQHIIGMINDATGNRNIDVGKIEILGGFSFFEVHSNHTDLILDGFEGFMRNKLEIVVEIASKKKGKRGSKAPSKTKRRKPKGVKS